MSFQWIIDNAVDIQVNKRPVVASTTARDQTMRSVSRGGKIWRFIVTPSPGTRWYDPGIRSKVEVLDTLGRYTVSTIKFNTPGLEWLYGFQGSTAPTSVTVTQGSDVISHNGSIIAGDLIQMVGKPHVYSFADSTHLNRPFLNTSGSYSVVVGKNCQFSVICLDMPDYKINSIGLIEWSGPFTFVEDLTQ